MKIEEFLTEKRAGASSEMIRKFELDNDIILPTDFKNFYLKHDGGWGISSRFNIKIDEVDEVSDIQDLDSFEGIITNTQGTRENFQDERCGYIFKNYNDFIVFSYTSSAQGILLGIRNEVYGKVFLLYDFSLEAESTAILVFVANSFSDFIDMLYLPPAGRDF
jgi:hypothetical protein